MGGVFLWPGVLRRADLAVLIWHVYKRRKSGTFDPRYNDPWKKIYELSDIDNMHDAWREVQKLFPQADIGGRQGKQYKIVPEEEDGSQ